MTIWLGIIDNQVCRLTRMQSGNMYFQHWIDGHWDDMFVFQRGHEATHLLNALLPVCLMAALEDTLITDYPALYN